MAATIMKGAPIGFIGLGVIGGAMARNLLDSPVSGGPKGAQDGTLSCMMKDIRLAQSTGRDARTFMPVTALGLQLLTALCNSGRDSLDSAALGLLFEELSGIRR